MGSSTKTTSSNTIDPALMALYNKNYAQADALASQPFTPYTGQHVAGFTPTQLQAQDMLTGIAGSNLGADTLSAAKGVYGNLLNYGAPLLSVPGQWTPQTISAHSLSAPTVSSPGKLSAPVISPYATLTADTITSPGSVTAQTIAAPTVTAGMLRDTDLKPYLNPYQQNVIDTTLSDLARQRDIQRVADNQAATAAHAFGGSRQGVADSLTNEAYLRNVASTDANLRQQNYLNAQNAAAGDLSRQFGADTLNANNEFAARQANAASSTNAQQFNLQMLADLAKANAANKFAADQYNAAQGYDAAKTNAASQFAAQQANLANALTLAQFNAQNQFTADQYNTSNASAADLFNANAQNAASQFNLGTALDVQRNNAANDLASAGLRLNAGGQMLNLSNSELQQALQRAGALAAVGNSQQQNQQAINDAAFDEFMRMLAYPIQMQQLRSGALTQMPIQQTQTTTQKSSPGALDIFGTVLGAAKTAGGLGWI